MRKLKLTYSVYNFFQFGKLKNNIKKFKQLGINKFYFSPISYKDFKDKKKVTIPYNGKTIEETKIFQTTSEENKASLLQFEEKGYAILSNYLKSAEVQSLNLNVEKLLKTKKAKFVNGNKLMFLIHKSERIKHLGKRKEIIELVSTLMKGESALFQSINFIKGSEQDAHSDSIHMTTFPLGGLIGLWIALEDITMENGPLFYYEGSHKLPYYMNEDYDNQGSYFKLGDKSYKAYEEFIESKIQENKLHKKYFLAKKGDVLIWHANLIHGGEKMTNPNLTRKSMVYHYFDKNAICFHEITQRPALIKAIN